MRGTKKKAGTILVLMAVAILFAGSAYGGDFDNANRNSILRILPGVGNVGCVNSDAENYGNSVSLENLAGYILGGYLGYMIEKNRYEDRDHHYSDRNLERDRDRYDNRHRDGFNDRGGTRHDMYDRYDRRYDYRPY